MEKMKQLVRNLLLDSSNTVSCLQQINEALLKEYELHYNNYLSIQPLQVEIFYVNFQANPPFIDTNMQCVSSVNSKIDPEIWKLQSDSFGRLYFHLRGHGGIDICLSDSEQYALCSTIKSARINGEEIWGQSKVCEQVMQIVSEHEGISGKKEIAYQINNLDVQTISRRTKAETGYIYHMKRRLRHTDKNNSLLLHSLMDIWNKNLALSNIQRINIFMAAHPTEDPLEVMRRQGFRTIPVEVRIKYGISHKMHL